MKDEWKQSYTVTAYVGMTEPRPTLSLAFVLLLSANPPSEELQKSEIGLLGWVLLTHQSETYPIASSTR